MSNPQSRIVDCVSVGEPGEKVRKGVETVKFIIYDFKDRVERAIESPTLKAHGFKWRIRVLPRGNKVSPKSVSLFLRIVDASDIHTNFSFCCKTHEQRYTERMDSKRFWGGAFLSRERVLDCYLEEDGSLAIEVNIFFASRRKYVWYPKEIPKNEILADLYQNASSDTGDTLFSVEDKVYVAHKIILALRGNKLSEIANEWDVNKGQIVVIPKVSGEVFKILLDSVYHVNQPPEISDKEFATELLVAADRYEFCHVKLYAESVLVDKFLTATNAAALLIFADSYSCALLKEAASNLFVTDAKTVRQGEAWSQVRESNKLLDELLDWAASSRKRDRDVKDGSDIERWDVTSLRERLERGGDEVDGSREVLINRMKAHINWLKARRKSLQAKEE